MNSFAICAVRQTLLGRSNQVRWAELDT